VTKILFVGEGAGSWEVRGRQIGKALGARVTTQPTRDDWRWADLVILVKRAVDTWGATAKAVGVPAVWDVLDYWRQPEDNQRPADACIADVLQRRDRYRLAGLIGATQAMADDIGGVYIPHHARPGLAPVAPRGRVKVVAYEGTKKYLGSWLNALTAACEARGLQMAVNPPSLAAVDVVVAFRDGKWDGWACRRWKSGVKYVNALTAGKPVLTQDTAGYQEIRPVGLMISAADQLGAALDRVIVMSDLAYETAKHRQREFSIETTAAPQWSCGHLQG